MARAVWGGIGSMVGNMVSNAVSNAISNTNKKPSSGSSSSRPSGSGGTISSNASNKPGSIGTVVNSDGTVSKPSSGGGSSASRPGGTTGTRPGGMTGSLAGTLASLGQGVQSALGNSGVTSGGYTGKTVADYQKAWQEAQARGDTGAMAEAHAGAEALRKQQGYSGGTDGSQKIVLGGSYRDSEGNVRHSSDTIDYAENIEQAIKTGNYDLAQMLVDQRGMKLNGAYDGAQVEYQRLLNAAYADRMQQQAEDSYKQVFDSYAGKGDAIIDGISADVERNIANLNAQRPLVQQAGAQANAAAQQGYYSAINPNGMSAEQRAALGLSDSGLTESAQIAASNAYQSAVNSNAQNVSNQLAQIDLAIENARLSGDIATAQQLQSYYDTVLQAGMQAAGQIANINQWALENKQNQFQQNVQNGFTQAGITGQYNGQLTLAGQQAVREFQSMDTQNKLNALNLAIQQAYGMKSADADYLIKMAQLQGQNLDNLYLQAQIEYARKQF